MRSRATHSRTASRFNQSTTRRWTAGSDTRRRSPRGGKRPAPRAGPGDLMPVPGLLPDQEAVGQQDGDRVPVGPGPQPPLVLVPPEQLLRLLVVPLHPMPPVRVLDELRQRRPRPEVTPVELPP